MVEQIYDVRVLKKLIEQDVPAVCVVLNEKEVKRWKEEGRFKFLKQQLQDIPNLRFACVKQSGGDCDYHFILKTVELKDRLANLLYSLCHGEFICLTKCSNTRTNWSANYSTEGEATVCQLF